MRDQTHTCPVALTLASYGLLCGFVIALLALFMAGGGHGWGEGLLSSVAIVLAPVAGVAWAYRRHGLGLVLASLVLAPAACFDWLLCTYTGYVDRVWQFMPGVFVCWVSLWVAWQVMALGVFLSKFNSRAVHGLKSQEGAPRTGTE